MLSPVYWRQTRYSIDLDIEDRGWSIRTDICVECEPEMPDRLLREKLQQPKTGYIEPSYLRMKLKNKNKALRLIAAVINVDGLLFQTMLDMYRTLTRGPFRRHPYHMSWSRKEFYNELPPINLVQAWFGLTQRLKIIQLRRYYKSKCSKQLPENYVLFAPNFQPESTTQPSAGYYSSIIICLLTLRGKLPPNTTIVFKEHNSCFDLRNDAYKCRSKKFYQQVLEVHNTEFAPYSSTPTELIEKSLFVVTQSSTIAIEASLRKKVTVTFGSAWFNDLEYIVKWSEVEKLSDFSEIANGIDVGKRKASDVLDHFNKYTFRDCSATEKLFEEEARSAASLLNEIVDLKHAA